MTTTGDHHAVKTTQIQLFGEDDQQGHFYLVTLPIFLQSLVCNMFNINYYPRQKGHNQCTEDIGLST